MMEIFFFTTFGKAFVPKGFRVHLHRFFQKSGLDEVPYHTFGILFWVCALITYLFYMTLIYPELQRLNPLSFFLASFVSWTGVMLTATAIFGLLVYFWYGTRIYKRTKEMEEKLPDYLTLVSTSLKGGYSFEKALWGSIKPEFGVLAREIGLVSKRVMTGNDVSEALEEFAEKYDSPILRRAVNLITGELESGGKVVDVIDRVILDLKKTRNLKQEMAASTLTYTIFISALVLFVLPLLFALSLLLFNVITDFITNIATSGAAAQVSVLKLTKPGVDPDNYELFALLAISIISTSSAMIVSIIQSGDIRGGLKYIPIFLVVSLTVYLLALSLLQHVFSGMMR